ncbi:hypothetical protein RJ639_027918 [Escallonia herrerae]|uniref:Integrase zinc-binding domain-containing protein n=1 Tax=Escallonia herrerae TaxID=1293975 RepID=A0AA88X608_9ASTE|nr:hypothetical protein RJ639_027918 [Escallonia herrerae]
MVLRHKHMGYTKTTATAFNARKALLEYKHTGSVREYCQAFSALMLDISDMSAVDRLFFFMEGLKPWARTELNRRRVNNLNKAIIATESLSDYNSEPQRPPQRGNPSRSIGGKKPGGQAPNQSWVQHGAQFGSQSRHPPTEEQTDVQDYEEEDAVGAFPQWCNAVTTQSRQSRVAINIEKKIKKALTRDPVAQQLLKLIESGKTRQFWQEDGLLMTKGRWVYVPRVDDLRQTLIQECHDTLWVGHVGGEITLTLLQQGYYWPQMGDEVQEYVNTCLTCQLDKVESKKKAGLLQLLPVPKRPWESVSLDFITSLPKVEDLGTILVVVDRFSKYASFIATPKYCSAEYTTQLFFKYVVKYWGMPQDIVRKSAFEIVNGQQPLLPHTVNVPNAEKSPRAISFSEEWRQNIDLAHSYLEKAARRMKKHADKNRRSQEFNVGDKVMVKLLPQDRKFLRGRDSHLLQKYQGPLTIMKKIGKMAYKADPPHWWSR